MGTEIVDVNAAWSAAADEFVKNEPLQGNNFLSTKGGVLTFNEAAMPGNQCVVIVLDSVHENTYYTDKFDPDDPSSPVCYAFGREAEDMAPHISMRDRLDYFQPQNATCNGCPMNEWGSADTGRGKACQNRRRLALIPAGFYAPRPNSRDFDLQLFTDPADFQKGEVAYLRVPVTSTKEWSKYVNQVAASIHRPPYGVLTRIWLEPDAKTQYKTLFEVVEEVPDELARIVMDRHASELKMPFQGYQPPDKDGAQGGDMGGFRRPGA